MEIKIRNEDTKDIAQVREILRAAFPTDAESKLVDSLRAKRFGFEKASQFGVQNEYGVDDEFMITRFTERGAPGLVKYAPEFGMFAV